MEGGYEDTICVPSGKTNYAAKALHLYVYTCGGTSMYVGCISLFVRAL